MHTHPAVERCTVHDAQHITGTYKRVEKQKKKNKIIRTRAARRDKMRSPRYTRVIEITIPALFYDPEISGLLAFSAAIIPKLN